MAGKAGIDRRRLCFAPLDGPEGDAADRAGLFRRGAVPRTGQWMDLPEDAAAGLEAEAVDGLGFWPEADTRRIVAELRLDRGIVRCAGLNP